MKKIAVILLSLAVIGMANTPQNSKNKNLKTTQNETNQNDAEIKKIVDEVIEMYRAELKGVNETELNKIFGESGIKSQIKELEKDMTFETKKEKDFYEKVMTEMFKILHKNLKSSNFKFKIYQGKTSYLSNNSAKVELIYEMIDFDSFDKNDEVLDRAFEKSGITDEELETLNIENKKLEKLYSVLDNEIKKEIENTTLSKEVFSVIELKKNNGTWEIVDIK